MLSVNKDEIMDNISWGNLRSREWKDRTMHIVFISNFTDNIDDMVTSQRLSRRNNFGKIDNFEIIFSV